MIYYISLINIIDRLNTDINLNDIIKFMSSNTNNSYNTASNAPTNSTNT